MSSEIIETCIASSFVGRRSGADIEKSAAGDWGAHSNSHTFPQLNREFSASVMRIDNCIGEFANIGPSLNVVTIYRQGKKNKGTQVHTFLPLPPRREAPGPCSANSDVLAAQESDTAILSPSPVNHCLLTPHPPCFIYLPCRTDRRPRAGYK